MDTHPVLSPPRAGPRNSRAAHIHRPEAVGREGEGEGVGGDILLALMSKGPDEGISLFCGHRLAVGFGYCLLVPNKTGNQR